MVTYDVEEFYGHSNGPKDGLLCRKAYFPRGGTVTYEACINATWRGERYDIKINRGIYYDATTVAACEAAAESLQRAARLAEEWEAELNGE